MGWCERDAEPTRKSRAHMSDCVPRMGGFYWAPIDGTRLLRGDGVDAAEELQESFAETMARAGETPPKRTR
jgi:hypothetical protein